MTGFSADPNYDEAGTKWAEHYMTEKPEVDYRQLLSELGDSSRAETPFDFNQINNPL